MQGLFRRAVASVAALVLLAPTAGEVSFASSPHRALVTVALATPPQRIPVKEPARVKPSPPPADAFRPKIVQGARAHGVRMAGPPMLGPLQVDHVIREARRRAMQSPPAPTIAPPGRAVSQPANGMRPGTRRAMSLPSDPTASGTGINHWWRYQEENVPGGGHVMVNVGTGNLLLQDDDMAVPHKGIAMAFRRTYNSQSPTTVSGDLQTWTGLYGNGWTNTFDAHVIRTSPGHFSVYDIDGARYDFVPSGTPGLVIGPPGQPTTLQWDGACGLLWQKKSGTLYYFYDVNSAKPCSTTTGTVGGYAGRIYQIIGRNRNTSITFSYSWDNGDASASGKISGITATTESGMAATLAFADVNGRRLLQQITFPDGVTTVSYGYDANGNLTSVSRPPNNAAGIRPMQSFGYVPLGTGFVMQTAGSPRVNAACGTSAGCYSDGGGFVFSFMGSTVATSALSTIQDWGNVNPTIADGTAAGPVQGTAYSNSVYAYNTEYYTTGVTTPTFRDTAGHMTNWIIDGLGRPTQTQACTASASQGQTCTGTWLVTNQTWDANNNQTSETDPRGNETDYAYDANGNTIAIAQPQPTPGGFRPTSLYSYDTDPNGVATNNIVSYCDPVATHRISADWQSPPVASDNLCPRTMVALQFVFSYPSSQPNGRLEQSILPGTVAAPNGYHKTFLYNAGQQGGADYGLPTQVQGDSMQQPDPVVPSRQPLEEYWYDVNGQVQCYHTGNGYWLVSYDSMGRTIRSTDPDDGIVSSAGCAKTGGRSGWDASTTYTYYPDGSKASVQTPAQRVLSTSTQYTYDLDSNVVSETHAFSCTAAPCSPNTTTKFYDGADRLVEVMLPYGPGDAWQTPWKTRYLYDLSQGGTDSIPGATFSAYGNLAVTQEYLPVDIAHPPWSWKPLKATAFDAADRKVADYAFSPGQSSAYATTYAYDGSGQLGLLSSRTDALHQAAVYAYDNVGRKTSVQYQNATSPTYSKQFTFDADGRPLTEASGIFGTQSNIYDWNGVLLTRSISAYGPIPATTLKYDYYPDSKAKDIAATLAPLSQTTPIETWSYRTDGRRASTIVNYASNSYKLTESYTSAGRLQAASDDFSATNIAYDASGQETSRALPGGSFSNEKHDAEGVLNSYTGYQNYFPPSGTSVTNSLSVRGELSDQYYSPDFAYDHTPLNPAASSLVANGYIDRMFSAVDIWDVRTKMPLSQWGNPGNTGQDFTYDAVGRIVSSNDGWSGWNGNGVELDHSGSYTKTYDAENHLVGQSLTTYNVHGSKLCPGDYNPSPPPPNWASTVTGSFSYVWNVDDHPWIIDGQGVIWNGDQPFISMSGGSIAAIRIDDRAVIQPGVSDPLLVIDRDMSGEAVSFHDKTGFTGVTFPGRYAAACTSAVPGGTSTRGGGALSDPISQPRPDGIWDGVNMIQGVRNYDAAIGGWTTPDAYKGNVHDPMSQQPYMWNRNNPYAYSDPSGYDVIMLIDPHSAGAAGHQSMFVYDPKTLQGTFWQAGPANGANSSGRFTLSDKLVVTKQEFSLKDLTSHYGGQNYFHIGTSSAADARINGYMQGVKDGADAGKVRYNVLDNQCAQITGWALESAGVPAGFMLTEWPRANDVIMQGLGWQVNPDTIPAAGAKG